MSLSFSFNHNRFSLKSVRLPSRYFYFKEGENYIKLLTVGEGLFPKDRLNTTVKLCDSTLVLASESATKIYPSNGAFACNRFELKLTEGSNVEYINDELILFDHAKFIQFFRLDFDESSTFFYADILSQGRSFEHYGFTRLMVRNAFTMNGILEYCEKSDMDGMSFQSYLLRRNNAQAIVAKLYIRSLDFEGLCKGLEEESIYAYAFSQNKQMVIVVLIGEKISQLKADIARAWRVYRQGMGKKEFDLGKQ